MVYNKKTVLKTAVCVIWLIDISFFSAVTSPLPDDRPVPLHSFWLLVLQIEIIDLVHSQTT